MKNVIKENIILQQQSLMHQANRTSVTQYEIVLADAIARYKRSQGYDVFFQTGTDEHGQKIELKADEAGVTPKEFVDNASGEIKKIMGSDEHFL